MLRWGSPVEPNVFPSVAQHQHGLNRPLASILATNYILIKWDPCSWNVYHLRSFVPGYRNDHFIPVPTGNLLLRGSGLAHAAVDNAGENMLQGSMRLAVP